MSIILGINLIYLDMQEDTIDLVIVGAGVVGMAMAYEARKNGRTCLLL